MGLGLGAESFGGITVSNLYKYASPANLYSIAYRLQTAKRSETKIKRIKLIIDMLARGEKFH